MNYIIIILVEVDDRYWGKPLLMRLIYITFTITLIKYFLKTLKITMRAKQLTNKKPKINVQLLKLTYVIR